MEWRRCLNLIGSSQITTRTRGVKTLNALLDSRESLNSLAQSEARSSVSMSSVFCAVNELVCKEGLRLQAREKRGRSSMYYKWKMELRRTVANVFKSSGEYNNKLAIESLVTALTNVFSSSYLRELFGCQYYNSTINFLFYRRSYWGKISVKTWKELIKLSILAYNDKVLSCEILNIAKSIAFLISLASRHCDISLWITDRLKFFVSALSKVNPQSTRRPEYEMMMALSFSSKIAKENRDMACMYGESVLGTVLKFYNPQVTEMDSLKAVVLEFLIFQLKIHHPNGATFGSRNAYAEDPKKWAMHIISMYGLVQDEILMIPKRSHSMFQKDTLLGRFMEFSVDVVFQMIKMSEANAFSELGLTDADSDKSSEPIHGPSILEFLKKIPVEVSWAWMTIISSTIQKYNCIDEISYMQLLTMLLEHVSSKTKNVMDSSFVCCASLAHLKLAVQFDCRSQWQKMWDMAVWTIGLNQCEASAHEAVQAILSTNKLNSVKLCSDILTMYKSNNVMLSTSSVKTLQYILTKFSVLEDLDLSSRQHFFQWTFGSKKKPKSSQKLLPVDGLADLFSTLCLKRGTLTSNPSASSCIKGNVEDLYQKIDFCCGLMIPHDTQLKETVETENYLDEESFALLKDFIVKENDDLIAWVDKLLTEESISDEGFQCAKCMAHHLAILVTITSNLICLKVNSVSNDKFLELLSGFSELMNCLQKLIVALLIQHRSSLSDLSDTLHLLIALYDLDQVDSLSYFIRKNTPPDFIHTLMNIIKIDDAEDKFESKKYMSRYIKSSPERYVEGTSSALIDCRSVLDPEVVGKDNYVKVLSCKLLGAYCCIQDGVTIILLQKQIISYFLRQFQNEEGFIFPLKLQMIICFLYKPMNSGTLDVGYLSAALDGFHQMMEDNSSDHELLQIFLTVLERILFKKFSGFCAQETILVRCEFYIKKSYMLFGSGILPPSVIVSLIQLIGSIIKVNPSLTWPWLLSSVGQNITISDYMLQLLDSPYSEVRMVVAENIWPLFKPLRLGKRESRATLYLWLKYITSVCPEERDIMASSILSGSIVKVAIHCLCVVAVSSPLLRKGALYHILKLIQNYKISQDTGKLVFNLLAKEMWTERKTLIKEYLWYFLEKWVVWNDLEDFPFWLVNDSRLDFYLENAGIIFSNLWVVNNARLEGFCTFFEKTIPEMLKEHSAMVVALTLMRTLNNEESGLDESLKLTTHHVIDQLQKLHPDSSIYEILSHRCNSIMYIVFKLHFDEDDVGRILENKVMRHSTPKVCYFESNPNFYSKEMISRSMDYITSCCIHGKKMKFVSYLICEVPAHLRHVTFLLAKDAINAPTPTDSLANLMKFNFFVQQVIRNLMDLANDLIKVEHVKKVCSGFVRDVCFSFLRLMKKKWVNGDDAVCATAFIYFEENLQRHFVPLLKGLHVILVPMVGALADLVKDGIVQNFQSNVIELIQSILETECLAEDFAYLCPFPNKPEFANLQSKRNNLVKVHYFISVKEEINRFLEFYNIFGWCKLEFLEHLQTVLKLRKPQMKELYKEIEQTSGSFMKYHGVELHKLVCLLSMLCTSSEPPLRTAAAKCLAELGLGNIQAIVLLHNTVQVYEGSTCISDENRLKRLTVKCFELLPKYLLDDDVKVVEVASSALFSIINSKEGEVAQTENLPSQFLLAVDYTIQDPSYVSELSLSPLEFNEQTFKETCGLWVPPEDLSHSKWISALVISLLKCFYSSSSYLESLVCICDMKVALCEELFPFVLEIFLRCGQLSCLVTLFERIRHFFEVCYDTYSTCRTGMSSKTAQTIQNKASIVSMLNAVNYLNLQHPGFKIRKNKPQTSSRQLRSNVQNDGDSSEFVLIGEQAINYLHCAVAAQNCSAYFSAIQYCALWLSSVSKGNEPNTLVYHIKSGTPHVNEILYILRESYAGLDDVDALYGCGTSHLLEPIGRIEHFKHLDKWEQVMRSYELELSSGSCENSADGLLKAIQMVGMNELLMGLIEERDQEEIMGYKYECGWRLGSWDLLSKLTSKKRACSSALLMLNEIPQTDTLLRIDEDKINTEFHRNLFLAIRCIRSKKFTESLNLVHVARECVIDSLSLLSLEAIQNLYRPLSRLHALKEVEDFSASFKTSGETALPSIINQWTNSDLFGHKSLKVMEPVKAMRLTLLKYCFVECMKPRLTSSENLSMKTMAKIMLELGETARREGMFSVSEKYLRAIRDIPDIKNNVFYWSKLRSEEAKLFWDKGDQDVAKILMQSLIDTYDPLVLDDDSCLCYADALLTYGNWVMETHSERAKIGLSKYFGESLDLLDNFALDKDFEWYSKAVESMAVYADEQFTLTAKYISSSSYAQKQEYATHSKYIVSDYKGVRKVTYDEKKSLNLLEKQAQLDEKELEACISEKDSYLGLALSYYVKYLKLCCPTKHEVVFRLISLILQNPNECESIYEEMKTIPTHKFIPVIPQLLPRIVISKGLHQITLKSIVEKCAMEHPHHVLPSLCALAFSLKDLDKAKGSDAFITETQRANEKAAQKMIAHLRRLECMKLFISQIQSLWEALITLSNTDVDARCRESVLPNRKLLKIKSLECVHVLTAYLPVNPDGEYEHIVSIWKYNPTFSLVGGINLPKKITCWGNDGKEYPQLLKGRDDLRQDAVMQQVFKMMNSLLYRDEEAKKRCLRIRTYKVVPLSHRSGIIEWCEDTTAIGTYLHGNKNLVGAHAMFNPADYTVKTCRTMLNDVQSSSKKVKLQVFLDICENLQPVFRNYFFSKYPNPGIWYEKRQAYTRSVATSSIIGYVLGLGDRHLQNILIDKCTAEVLHVDLGIAFEQGRTLNTPETVPFRLTRDIVDGMGMSGVEGVFRRSCEVTMTLMRKYRQAILTVLEVLIYDPLYAWTLKAKYKILEADIAAGRVSLGSSTTTATSSSEEIEAAKPEETSSEEKTSSKESSGDSSSISSARGGPAVDDESNQSGEKNTIAIRALERLEHKLLGLEDGDPTSSVEAQVEKLIREAQDPENLCVLFPGWQPYL